MDLRAAVRGRVERASARLVRTPALRNVTLSSRVFGPPRRVVTTATLRARGAEVHDGTPGYVPDWSGLRYDDDAQVVFTTPPPGAFPQRDVVLLPRGRVLSEHGWSVTSRDEVVTDASFVHEEARFRYFEADTRRRPLEVLRGDVLNLTSTWSSVNYGHALLDAVGRLAIVRAAGLPVEGFDWFVVPDYRSAEVDLVLDRAGVPADRRIAAGASTHLEAERLWVTGFPGTPRCYSRYVPEYLRSLLTDEERGGDARVWLGRAGGKRALSNQAEAEALVRAHGYEPFEPGPGANGLLTLARASAVAGTHGAAMSSIAVCAPGTTVTEILPTGHRYPYFATLAVSAGHRYSALPGVSVSAERDADFTVDLDRLDAALTAAEDA